MNNEFNENETQQILVNPLFICMMENKKRERPEIM